MGKENIKSIKFTFWQKFKLMFRSCQLKKKKMESYEEIFLIGENKIKNELNMFTILQTISKIKATLSILVDNNDDTLYKI